MSVIASTTTGPSPPARPEGESRRAQHEGAPASPADWREIMDLLDTGLDLAPEARTTWLEALHRTHGRLAPMIEELLGERLDEARAGFLQAPAPLVFEAAVETPALAAQATVGPYRLLREIGQGGMASVWLAERADGLLERQVALKLPHVSWGGSALAERMARERNILASLTHPNIARLYDAGVAADGRPFLALEYVDGMPIDLYASSRGLDLRARVGLIVQVARAVAYAHSQLVVHRDLKPSNILVDGQGHALLLDFGIARLLDPVQDRSAEGSPATLMLGRLLTPDYASPEQIRGEAAGAASDIYTLGVVAYELLAGVRPYRLRTDATVLGLSQAIALVEPRPASTMAPDKNVGERLRGDLDAILGRALAQRADERYSTMQALADDLERHLRGEPVLAHPPSRAYIAERWVRRHKAETGIALGLIVAALGGAYAQVLVSLALGAGALAALWQRNRALEQAVLAREALARGEQVKDFIASIFTQAVPRTGQGGAVVASDLLLAASQRLDTDLVSQPKVAAELAALIGASLIELGEVQKGLAWLPKAVTRCTRELGATHVLTLQTRRRWVEAANFVGELTVSDALLPALVHDLRAVQPPQPALLVQALQNQAFALTKRAREGEALAALHEAVELATTQLGEASESALTARASLANTLIHFGHRPQALQAIAPAFEAARATYGSQRPHQILILVERNHADALTNNHRPREAVQILRQVLLEQRALDTCETPRQRWAMSMLAWALAAAGHLDEGRALQEEAGALLERLSGPSNHECSQLLDTLGRMCAWQGDGAAALGYIDRAAAIVAALGEGAARTQRRAEARLLALALVGRHAEVLALTEALDGPGADVPAATLARSLHARATALRETGRTSEGLAAVQKALTAAADPAVMPLERGLMRLEAARGHEALGDAVSAAQQRREALADWAAGQVDGDALVDAVRARLDAARA